MKKEDILEKLKEIIASIMKTDVSGVSRESRLKEDLRADSLDKINMLMALEEAYDIEMDEEEALTFKTVGDVVDYLVKELSCTCRTLGCGFFDTCFKNTPARRADVNFFSLLTLPRIYISIKV